VDERARFHNLPKEDEDVAKLFIIYVFKDKTYSLNDFDDPKRLNICEHSPPSIYKAFEYYAHKQYTLIRLGREFLIEDLYEKWKSELINKLNDESKSSNYWALIHNYNDFIKIYEKNKKLENKGSDIAFAWDVLRKLFMDEHERLQKLLETDNSRTDQDEFKISLTAKINNILESTPNEYESRYIPTEFIILARQISGQLGHGYYKNINPDRYNFPESDMQYIRKCWKILLDNLDLEYLDNEERYKINNTHKTFERIKILFEKSKAPGYKIVFRNLSDRIDELYKKCSRVNELNEETNNKNNEYSSIINLEDAKIFANNFLIKEFNTVKDRDFIKSIGENGEWSISWKEFDISYKESGSLIINLYSGKYENVNKDFFFYKLKKALKEYKKWNKKRYKEGKNIDDN